MSVNPSVVVGEDPLERTDSSVASALRVLFFASSNDLVYQFDYAHDPQNVIIDLSEAQIYDSSTVAALDAIVLKYHNKGKHVEIIAMSEASRKWHALSGNLGADTDMPTGSTRSKERCQRLGIASA